jgi:hypothetical protein
MRSAMIAYMPHSGMYAPPAGVSLLTSRPTDNLHLEASEGNAPARFRDPRPFRGPSIEDRTVRVKTLEPQLRVLHRERVAARAGSCRRSNNDLAIAVGSLYNLNPA